MVWKPMVYESLMVLFYRKSAHKLFFSILHEWIMHFIFTKTKNLDVHDCFADVPKDFTFTFYLQIPACCPSSPPQTPHYDFHRNVRPTLFSNSTSNRTIQKLQPEILEEEEGEKREEEKSNNPNLKGGESFRNQLKS